MHSGKEKNKRASGQTDFIRSVSSLYLLNDDVNSFEHVIEVLMDLCHHSYLQAEQCAMLTHLKGSCSIKSGSKTALESLKQHLNRFNLKAEIR